MTTKIDCSMRIGYIRNAAYRSNSSILISYNDTCSECLCSILSTGSLPQYVGLNCYHNNKTCQLLANYLSSSEIETNFNSTFIIIQQTAFQNTTTAITTPIEATTAVEGIILITTQQITRSQTTNLPTTITATSEITTVTTTPTITPSTTTIATIKTTTTTTKTTTITTTTTTTATTTTSTTTITTTTTTTTKTTSTTTITTTTTTTTKTTTTTTATATTTAVPFPLSGVTVAGYGNGTAGNNSNGLQFPWGVIPTADDFLYVADFRNSRVMKFKEGNVTGTMIGGTGVSGNAMNQLNCPATIVLDTASNLYMNDDLNCRVMRWRQNSTSGSMVAGTGLNGTSTSRIGYAVGLAVDSQGNMYVAEYQNHRVTKWAPNATNGTVVAGKTGIAGNTSQLLNQPYGLFLDENSSYLYIADMLNNRIQRYTLGITANGTTVAGGNGVGNNSNQLNQPYSVYVSKKTGDIYIADKANHRIQRWTPGHTSGETITGITGVALGNATGLSAPGYVTLNANESFMYVADRNNHRVQRYKLP